MNPTNQQVQDLFQYMMPENANYTITVNKQTNQVYTNLRTTRPNSNSNVANNSLLMGLNDNQANQPRQQLQNANLQIVRSPQVNRGSNPKKINILQDISIRSLPSTSVSTTSSGPAPKQRQRVIQGTISGTKEGLNVASELLRNVYSSNGQQFVVLSNTPKNGIQTNNVRMSITRAPTTAAAPQQGNLPTMALNDYPEYSFTIHSFSNAHKNIMPEMASFVREMFNVLIPASSYMLMLSVDFSTCICVEVEANVFGIFVCKLICDMLAARYFPFVLEIKSAPSNWSNELKKSIVVSKHNFVSAAKKIAHSLRNRESYLADNDTLPDQLDLKFTVRRGNIRIQCHVASESAETIFANIYKSKSYFTKAKEVRNAATQANCSSVAPARFMELHKMQAEFCGRSTQKQNARFNAIFAHIDRIEEFSDKQRDLNITLSNNVKNISEMKLRIPITSRAKKGCSKSVQTNFPTAKNNSISLRWPSFEEYNTIVKKIISYSTKYYKSVQLGIEKLQHANKLMKLELAQKKCKFEESKLNNYTSKINPKTRQPMKYEKIDEIGVSLKLNEIKVDSSANARVHLNMLKYMSGYERIISKLQMPEVEPKETNSANLTLCDGDLTSLDSFFNMPDCDLITLDSLDNLMGLCYFEDPAN